MYPVWVYEFQGWDGDRIAEQRWEEALDTVVIADAAATANLSTAANIGPKVLSAFTPPLLALVSFLVSFS